MFPALFRLFAAYTAIAFIVGAWFVYVAATESDGRRKGNARFIASLLFSSWCFLTGLLQISYEHSHSVIQLNGIIASTNVLDSSDLHYSAWICIDTSDRGKVNVHTSDRSPYFHPGERIRLRYHSDNEELLTAAFSSGEGRPEGVLRRWENLQSWALLLIGLICVWASVRRYQRHPDGSEKTDEQYSALF